MRLAGEVAGRFRLSIDQPPRYLRRSIGIEFEYGLLAEGGAPVHREVVSGTPRIFRAVPVSRIIEPGNDEKRVRDVDKQPVLRDRGPRPVHGKQRHSLESDIGTHRRLGEGGTAIEPGHGIGAVAEQDGRGQLVIRQGNRERRRRKSGLMQHGLEFGTSPGTRAVRIVQIAETHHRPTKMILRRACKILKTQLVLDREEQYATRVQHLADETKPVYGRIVARRKPVGVFENAHECDRIEALRHRREGLEIIDDDLHVRQIAAASSRHPRALRRRLQRVQLGGNLAEITAQRAATGSDFQHAATEQAGERPQQVGSACAEVVAGRPVDDACGEFGRKRRAIGALLDRIQELPLHLLPVTVGPGTRFTFTHPQSRVRASVERTREPIFLHHQITLSSARRSVMPRNPFPDSRWIWTASYRLSCGTMSPLGSRLAMPNDRK